jgi:hypothetical protein
MPTKLACPAHWILAGVDLKADAPELTSALGRAREGCCVRDVADLSDTSETHAKPGRVSYKKAEHGTASIRPVLLTRNPAQTRHRL